MLKLKFLLFFLLSLITNNTFSLDIIGNNSVKQSISKKELRDIFEGKTYRWNNGHYISVFILPSDHIATKQFAWMILGISPEAWKDIKTSSIANSQRNKIQELKSELDMVRFISLTNGSIGYINNTFMVNKNGKINFITVTN